MLFTILIEEHVYKEYMDKLFSMSKKYVIIYAKNEDIIMRFMLNLESFLIILEVIYNNGN